MLPRLQAALDNLLAARAYSRRLIDSIDPADWFTMPGGVTHVAWQVGHLAFAEYRLCLLRVRGPLPDDTQFLPELFFNKFGIHSIPDPDPSRHPTPTEVIAVYDRVHERVLAEWPSFEAVDLDTAPATPHGIAKTKMECLFWASRHEMLHAGQIGLLRRLFGKPPLW